jgi:hypothetical protein
MTVERRRQGLGAAKGDQLGIRNRYHALPFRKPIPKRAATASKSEPQT